MYGGSRVVPANGVIMLMYGCNSQCDTIPDPEALKVVTQGGYAIAGSVIRTDGDDDRRQLVFKPEEGALVEGQTYELDFPGVEIYGGFTVVGDVAWSSTHTPPSDQIYASNWEAGEEICCEGGPVDSCGSEPCFHSEYLREAYIAISWGDGSSAEDYQYAHRVLRPGGDAEPPWNLGGPNASYTLGPDEVTTCYTLELLRLVDDEVLTLDERCVDRPEDIIPGLYALESEEIQSAIGYCENAPPGYEEEWCAYAERICADGGGEKYCVRAMSCEVVGTGGSAGAGGSGATGGSDTSGGTGATGGSDTSGGTGASGGSAGAGGSAATGGSGGSAGAPDDASGEADGDGKTVRTNAGCGCTVPVTHVPVEASLWSLLVLAFYRRRRLVKRA